MKYMKKAIEVEAIQWDGTIESSHQILKLCGKDNAIWYYKENNMSIRIDEDVLEDLSNCPIGDYIVKEDGKLYICNKETFSTKYDIILGGDEYNEKKYQNKG